MNRLSTAAAFHGSALNPHYPVGERLRVALAALERYEAAVEKVVALAEGGNPDGWVWKRDLRAALDEPEPESGYQGNGPDHP